MIYYFRPSIFRSLLTLIICGTLLSGCGGEFAYKRGGSASDLQAAKAKCKDKESNATAFEKCLSDQGWEVQQLSNLNPLASDPVIESSAIPSNQRIENISSSTSLPASAKSNGSSSHGSTEQTSPTQKVADMKDIFIVNSWWKLGGGAGALKSDITACVSKLGEAHRPDESTQRATRGLLLCMKEKGWSALRAK